MIDGNKKELYHWFLKHKMSVYMKEGCVYYSGVWNEEQRKDRPIRGWPDVIDLFEKYMVNK
ncbi:MAG: hypothetical protein WC523_04750 [Patescibacteria group bacterium]